MSINTVLAPPVEYPCGAGRVYKFARLSLEDWAAYCEHIQATRLAQISALDLPPKEKQQLYREVVREAIDSEEMFVQAMTLTGMRWLLHRSITRHHDEIKIGEVGGIVGSIAQMTDLIVRVADLPEGDGEADADPPQAQ
jgi:hypothetical protein